MEYKKECKKAVMQKAAILPVLFCLLFSGCTSGRTEDVPYREASCQVLMHSAADSCYSQEDIKYVREK